jgi:hypothetical protein
VPRHHRRRNGASAVLALLAGLAFDQLQFCDGQRWQSLAIVRDPGGNPWVRASLPALGDLAATAAPVGFGESLLAELEHHPELDAFLALVIVFGVTALILEFRRRRKRA